MCSLRHEADDQTITCLLTPGSFTEKVKQFLYVSKMESFHSQTQQRDNPGTHKERGVSKDNAKVKVKSQHAWNMQTLHPWMWHLRGEFDRAHSLSSVF